MIDRKLQTGWRAWAYRGAHRAAQPSRRVLVGWMASGRPLYVPRPR